MATSPQADHQRRPQLHVLRFLWRVLNRIPHAGESLKIIRAINKPLVVMFDGQYLDAIGRNSINDPIWSFKQLPHFIVRESL
jgi:hypothetical protein